MISKLKVRKRGYGHLVQRCDHPGLVRLVADTEFEGDRTTDKM